MKKLLFSLVAGLLLVQAGAAESKWLTDLDAAKAQAKEQNKVILLNFTGSDW